MATFVTGQTIGRGDLDIFLTDISGNAVNAYSITYALYYFDGSVEMLTGPAQRIPVNPTVGEYYAAMLVPASAPLGEYRVRWTFQQTAASPLTQVVQIFTIAAPAQVGASVYSVEVKDMIDTLRLLLRDQCVGGEETVELDVGGERMIVRLDDLWEALLSETARSKLKAAYLQGTLKIQSVSPDGVMEWKPVVAVMRAEVPQEAIWEGETDQGKLTLTSRHRIFLTPTEKSSLPELEQGSTMLSISEDGAATTLPLRAKRQVENRQYMYDLTVADWHNFLLQRSRVVVSNSPDRYYHFRPPEYEGNLNQYNQVFGQIWEDHELHQYLLRALDWWNMFPPRTGEMNTLDKLYKERPEWRTAIYWGAIVHACFALQANWVCEEFSVAGSTLVTVSIPGQVVELSIEDLYKACKGVL